MSLVEDLGDGNWLIKPTGEIKECSRSTAYRLAKKAAEAQPETKIIDLGNSKEVDDSPEESTFLFDNVESNILEPGNRESMQDAPKTFQLPTLEEVSSSSSDTFLDEESQDGAADFLNTFKEAQVVEDDEGNKTISLGELWSGSGAIVGGILRNCDTALYAWAQDKHQIELWNPVVRTQQREMLVSVIGLIAPKTQVQLDPKLVLLFLISYLYGMPMLKIARHTRRRRVARPDNEGGAFKSTEVIERES